MVGTAARIPIGRRSSVDADKYSDQTAAKLHVGRRNSGAVEKFAGEFESAGLMIFGFLEESGESPETSCNPGDGFDCGQCVEEGEDEDESSCNVEENKAFWESQEQLLQATLRRSSSFESKIRQATKDALKEMNSEGIGCLCRRSVADGCRNCMQREISGRLRSAGYICNIAKSKWMNSPDIPSGEHTYLEVTENSSSKKGETRRVVIELKFRAEFEMARASEDYTRLIRRLPEAFVGKPERLKTLIKILCSAAKKCMREKKMHLPPWRKNKYMQAKWFGQCVLQTQPPPPTPLPPAAIVAAKDLDRPPPPRKQRTSMLTFDLVENLQSLHCTAIKVV